MARQQVDREEERKITAHRPERRELPDKGMPEAMHRAILLLIVQVGAAQER